VGILLCPGFCFIEFFVLVRLRHESLMTRLPVHDSIHDSLALKQPIRLFFRFRFRGQFGERDVAMCLRSERRRG
jgi:hypothetical protein